MASKNAAPTPDDDIIDLTDIIMQGIPPGTKGTVAPKTSSASMTDDQLSDLFNTNSALNVTIPGGMDADIDALLSQIDIAAPPTPPIAPVAHGARKDPVDAAMADVDSLLQSLDVPAQPVSPPPVSPVMSAPAQETLPPNIDAQDAELDALLGDILGSPAPSPKTAPESTPVADTVDTFDTPDSPDTPDTLDDLDKLLGGAVAASAGVVAGMALEAHVASALPTPTPTNVGSGSAPDTAPDPALLARIDALEARMDILEALSALSAPQEEDLSEDNSDAPAMPDAPDPLEELEQRLHQAETQNVALHTALTHLEERLFQQMTQSLAQNMDQMDARVRETQDVWTQTLEQAIDGRVREAQDTWSHTFEQALEQAIDARVREVQDAWTQTFKQIEQSLEQAAVSAAARVIREELTALLRE